MAITLTAQQAADQERFRAFSDERIAPFADAWDREERFPPEMIRAMAAEGFLGAVVPRAAGGTGSDMITFGLLHEQIGRGCSSARSLLTVHSMVAYAVHRWGSRALKERYLAALVEGALVGAFGLSEPNVGSDAGSIETTARPDGDSFVLNGCKKWTTFGQIADLFLVFARCDGKHTAFLVERDTPGLSVTPLSGILGTRASMLAELRLEECVVPKANQIGGLGFGLAAIATSALDIGRYSVAWGSVGIAQACLEASVRYSSQRRQGGALLKDHQLIRQLISQMLTNVSAARLLCLQAGTLKDSGNPNTVMETWVAKYFASTTAMKAALDAVQIHGANGCSADYAVQRYMRDAKVMEIIEGSTQLQEITIAEYAYANHAGVVQR
ncbi:MAG TPA: acyl-CoA dehydrogenase family protein [Roseiflexaceae bacterium]|nr:acyl-CoA dehydrogenase family protein [Roseiflexaceae bacterium]